MIKSLYQTQFAFQANYRGIHAWQFSFSIFEKLNAISIALILFLTFSKNSFSSSVFLPDSDTALLVSIFTNTAEQVVRLESLLSNAKSQLEYTKKIQETAESLESSYDRLTNIQKTFENLIALKDTTPENLEEINNKIEEIKDNRERILDLINESKKLQAKSDSIKDQSKIDKVKIAEVIKLDRAQIKRANSGKVKNQNQEVAKNTAYISSKLTETNYLLRKNIETTAQTNSLFAKNMAKQADEEKKLMEFSGIIKKEKTIRTN